MIYLFLGQRGQKLYPVRLHIPVKAYKAAPPSPGARVNQQIQASLFPPLV